MCSPFDVYFRADMPAGTISAAATALGPLTMQPAAMQLASTASASPLQDAEYRAAGGYRLPFMYFRRIRHDACWRWPAPLTARSPKGILLTSAERGVNWFHRRRTCVTAMDSSRNACPTRPSAQLPALPARQARQHAPCSLEPAMTACWRNGRSRCNSIPSLNPGPALPKNWA